MDTLISTFHIDIKLLIAQIINFGIVFAVLYYFALRPLLGAMKNRTATIEKSLADAKKIDQKMIAADEEYKKIIAGSKQEAAAVLQAAEAAAESKRKELLNKAKEEIGEIINQEKAKMQAEKAQTLKEIKSEVAGLVAASVEKILGEKIDAKKDKEIIKRVIKS